MRILLFILLFLPCILHSRYGLPDDRAGSYVQAADRAINEKHPQLVLCVASNNRADRYAAIKKKCIIDKPSKLIDLWKLKLHV